MGIFHIYLFTDKRNFGIENWTMFLILPKATAGGRGAVGNKKQGSITTMSLCRHRLRLKFWPTNVIDST